MSEQVMEDVTVQDIDYLFNTTQEEYNDYEHTVSIMQNINTSLGTNKGLSKAVEDEIEKQLLTMEYDNIPTEISATKKRLKNKKDINRIVSDFILTRSDKSWEELQLHYWYGIYSFAYKYTQNLDDAYDMTIETFLKVYKEISRYNPRKAKFSTWLWTVCRNFCLTYINNRHHLDIIDNDISDIYDSELFSESYLSHDIDVADYRIDENGNMVYIDMANADVELYDIVLNEIQNFTDKSIKDILWLKLVDNKKLEEISKELNLTISTVKNRYYPALKNLSLIIKTNYPEEYERYIEKNHQRDSESLYIVKSKTR